MTRRQNQSSDSLYLELAPPLDFLFREIRILVFLKPS